MDDMMAATADNGTDATKRLCVDHCVMIQCATNAKLYYYMLESQVKDKRKHVADLERQLGEAKDDLVQLRNELLGQKTTVSVLQSLCNHEEVIVLKAEDGMKKDVIDLCSGEEDWTNMNDLKCGVNNNESNIITPDKGRKRCKKQSSVVDDKGDVLK